MKKAIPFVLAAVVAFGTAACSGGGAANQQQAAATAQYETVGEIYASNPSDVSSSLANGKLIVVYQQNGTYYRVTADVPAATEDEYLALDVTADDYSQKAQDLVKDLKIASTENLSEGIPSKEELSKYVGQTGQALLDDGFECTGFTAMKGDISFFVTKGLYDYTVSCEWTDAVDKYLEDFNMPTEGDSIDYDSNEQGESPYTELLRDLKVTGIEFSGISWKATDI